MPISPYSAFSWNTLLVAFGYAMPLTIAPLMATVVGYPSAQARPRPDNSLGPESSIVTPQGNGIFNIEGGAIRDDVFLFHSFENFAIQKGQAVQFSEPAGPSIDTIITRVTGGRRSLIDGRLVVEGDADFFFLNPNGIVFGPDAELRVGGSFIATTADRIVFGDTFAFQADSPNTVPPLLSINTPTGLQMGGSPGAIKNQARLFDPILGRGLFLNPGQTLGLIGGEIALEPSSRIQVTQGRIELAAVGPNQTILMTPQNQGWAFNFDTVERFQNITAEQASIRGSLPLDRPEPSSEITLHGRNIHLLDKDGATVEIGGFNRQGVGGDLTLIATESIQLENILLAQRATAGNGGNIAVSTPRLFLNQTVMTTRASTRSSIGSIGGDITIDADFVLVEGFIVDPLNPGSLDEPSRISTDAAARSQAGILTLSADALILRNGGQLNSGLIDGQLVENSGSAGDINVNAPFIFLDDRAQITAATTGGQGNITLDTNILFLNNDSAITASGTGEASGGNIIINTNLITALDDSTVATTAEEGDGGLIRITTNGLIFSPDSTLDVSSEFGNDGTIELLTPDYITIEEPIEEAEDPRDPSRLVSIETCRSRRNGSSFRIVGKGGIRESPMGPILPNLLWEDWETVNAMMYLFDGLEDAQDIAAIDPPPAPAALSYVEYAATTIPPLPSAPSQRDRLIESQGWVRHADGTIELIDQFKTNVAQISLLNPHSCRRLHESLRNQHY